MNKKKTSEKDHTRLVYEGIRQLLFNNEIVPGQKISYRMIAERLGVSLTPVVQALKILEFQGLVKHVPNRGYYTEPLSLREIEEIYELREVLECSLLPMVIQNLDGDSITRLSEILGKKEAPGIELNQRLLLDKEFHLTLAAVSGRKIQIQMLCNLFDLLYLKYRGSLFFVASETVVGSQHQHIFDAVVTRDLEQAQQAMAQHFDKVKTRALSTLSQILAGKDLQTVQTSKALF